jgi:hypothetical protein
MSEEKTSDVTVDTKQETNTSDDDQTCCTHFWHCTTGAFSSMVYVLLIIIPPVFEIWPLVYYSGNNQATGIILIVHSSFLIIVGFIIGLRIFSNVECNNCNECNGWYKNPSSFKNFFTFGHLILIATPWIFTHLMCLFLIGLDQVQIESWIYVLALPTILISFLIGIGIGYSINETQTDGKPINCNCFRRSISIILYIFILITGIIFEAWPIIYYEDYQTTKITILIHTCLLLVLALITGIKLFIDVNTDCSKTYEHYYDRQCSDFKSFCTDPSEFKSMITGGYLLLVFAPWTAVNFICIGVWYSQLVSNDFYIIILGIPAIIFLFIIGLCIGFAITKEFKK